MTAGCIDCGSPTPKRRCKDCQLAAVGPRIETNCAECGEPTLQLDGVCRSCQPDGGDR